MLRIISMTEKMQKSVVTTVGGEKRASVLKVNPLCKYCYREGKITAATVVDHNIPHRGDKVLFWDENNWQPLCKRCHDRKTRTEDQFPEYKY
jgi:5-methylcytosine-specific restriction protein A